MIQATFLKAFLICKACVIGYSYVKNTALQILVWNSQSLASICSNLNFKEISSYNITSWVLRFIDYTFAIDLSLTPMNKSIN